MNKYIIPFPAAGKVCAVSGAAGASGFAQQTWTRYLTSQPGALGFLSGWKSFSAGSRTAASQGFAFPSPFCVLLFKREEDRALLESWQDRLS